MDMKPVIIVGEGLLGSLLAYRIKTHRPDVKFILLEPSLLPRNSSSWSFLEDEISRDNLDWIKPLISYQWSDHKVSFHSLKRKFNSTYCTILSGQFELHLRKVLSGDIVKYQGKLDLESWLNESSFIIDTRSHPQQRVKCHKVSYGVLVELYEPHGLNSPVMMDLKVKQKDLLRFLQYLPVDDCSVIVRDNRYVKDQDVKVNSIEEDLLWEIKKKWKVREVIHRESQIVKIPAGQIKPWGEGRILGLSSTVNLISGEEFSETVKMVEKLVNTSFRLGELREVCHKYHTEKSQRFFSRLIRKMLYHSPHNEQRIQVLKYLYKMPAPIVAKFHSGNISLFDLTKGILGNPPFPLMKVLPLSLRNV